MDRKTLSDSIITFLTDEKPEKRDPILVYNSWSERTGNKVGDPEMVEWLLDFITMYLRCNNFVTLTKLYM